MLSRREFFALTASAVTLVPAAGKSSPAMSSSGEPVKSCPPAANAFMHYQDFQLLKNLHDFSASVRTDKNNTIETTTEKDK